MKKIFLSFFCAYIFIFSSLAQISHENRYSQALTIKVLLQYKLLKDFLKKVIHRPPTFNLQNQKPIVIPSPGGQGISVYRGTTSPTFTLNNFGTPGSANDGGIILMENNQPVAALTLMASRRGWFITTPPTNPIYSPYAILVTSHNSVYLGTNAANTLANTPTNAVAAMCNVSLGAYSLYNLVNVGSNSYNVACGFLAGANIQGGANISIGAGALMGTRNPQQQNFSFVNSVSQNITGNNNIAIGTLSLSRLSGFNPLNKNNQNIAIGLYSLYDLVAGNNNIGIGTGSLCSSLTNNLSNSDVTFPTADSLIHNQATANCSFNIAIGYQALQRIVSVPFLGWGNIAIGVQAGANIDAKTNQAIFIGAPGPNHAERATYIGNIYGHVLDSLLTHGIPQTVYVNGVHELGTIVMSSDKINAIEVHKGNNVPPGSKLEDLVNNEIYKLPITLYRYPDDSPNALRFGIMGDTLLNDTDIVDLSSIAIYDQETGKVVSTEFSPLIPLLVVGEQMLINQVNALSTQLNALQAAFNAYVAAHP